MRSATRTAPSPRPATAPATPAVDPVERPDPSDGNGEHDRFAHYVAKRELDRSKRRGTLVTALCGKRWRPDGDPTRYPMCPTCSEIAGEMLSRGL